VTFRLVISYIQQVEDHALQSHDDLQLLALQFTDDATKLSANLEKGLSQATDLHYLPLDQINRRLHSPLVLRVHLKDAGKVRNNAQDLFRLITGRRRGGGERGLGGLDVPRREPEVGAHDRRVSRRGCSIRGKCSCCVCSVHGLRDMCCCISFPTHPRFAVLYGEAVYGVPRTFLSYGF
jgi:hypothetical protein